MRNYLLVFLAAVTLAPSTVSACGGCQTMGIREAYIAELTNYQHIFSAEVVEIETFKRPEYEEMAKKAKESIFGYGQAKVDAPDFASKLTVKLTRNYKGKLAASELVIWVKPTINPLFCDYFKYKKDAEYVFFLKDDKLEIDYYSRVYHTDFKKYDKTEMGWYSPEVAANIHTNIFKTLDILSKAEAGKVYKFYNSHNLVYAEGSFLNGKMDGAWNFYVTVKNKPALYESGTYTEGLKTGTWLNYSFSEGTIEQKTVYVNTEKDGKVFTYSQDKLSSETNFKDGQLDGEQIYYHLDGRKVAQISHFKDGALDGEWIIYDAEGVLIRKDLYKNNELVKA